MYSIVITPSRAQFPSDFPVATFYAGNIHGAVKWIRCLQRSFKTDVQPSALITQVLNGRGQLNEFRLGDFKAFVFQPSPIPFEKIPTVIDCGDFLDSV